MYSPICMQRKQAQKLHLCHREEGCRDATVVSGCRGGRTRGCGGVGRESHGGSPVRASGTTSTLQAHPQPPALYNIIPTTLKDLHGGRGSIYDETVKSLGGVGFKMVAASRWRFDFFLNHILTLALNWG